MLKDIITRISNDFIQEAKNSPRLFEDMALMEKYMAENYSGRIFIELIQNSDDAVSSKIWVGKFKDHLVVANNGRSFTESDVIAICRSGASSKERGKTIGYRGVGFKSTTYITDNIIIFSDRTYFSFSKSKCSEILNVDQSKIPTVRIPLLLEYIEPDLERYLNKLVLQGFTTIFIFMNANIDEIVSEINEISNGYFLFLNNITSSIIEIDDLTLNFEIKRNNVKEGTVISINGKRNDRWLVVDNNVSKIALKFDGERIIPCSEDEAVFHSYLPTLDKIAFPLKINCDFSTDPSRKHLTLDTITINGLIESANAIYILIDHVINGKIDLRIYSNLLTILSQQTNFSKPNSILCDNLNQIILSTAWVKINDGKYVFPESYKILPDWLEDSEKVFLRTNSKFVQNRSIYLETYKYINQIDTFLKQYSKSSYSTEDLIEIMKEEGFIHTVNAQTQGKILAHIITGSKTDYFISERKYDHREIIIPTNKGVRNLYELAMDNTIRINSHVKDAINQYSSISDIEWFCEKNSITKSAIIVDLPIKPIIVESELSSNQTSIKFSISKWRSAEQQCVEIEKYFGYDAKDVSKQNLGYDVESVTKDNLKRFIEVKSIGNIGSPFSLTNNEYSAAHQYGDNYYLCLIEQNESQLGVCYLQNPIKNLQLEKRIRQWEWYCDNYSGEKILIE